MRPVPAHGCGPYTRARHRRTGTAPRDTLWHADEHTLAKHRVLRSYLEAWIPILATQTGRLVLVDGFAGPGRYLDGEDGSPILMLKAFLEHKHRSAIDAQLEYLFIEKDEDRADYLDNEVRRVLADAGAPMNVTARSIHGEFAANLPTVLAAIGGTRRASMFVFIDPFGYTGWQLEQSGKILALPRCEVLAFVPLSHIARFLDKDVIAPSLSSLFGDDRWKEARRSGDRVVSLRRLITTALGEYAEHVRSFTLLDKTGSQVYELFFGTQNRAGLGHIKKAMWSVDPGGGYRFRDPQAKGQIELFTRTPDLTPLADMVRSKFGTRPFTIREAEDFVLFDTPYLHDAHLKRKTLAAEERAGRLEVLTKRARKGTYPAGTRMQFRPPGPPAARR
jgi:three-Cys-motif partner protein